MNSPTKEPNGPHSLRGTSPRRTLATLLAAPLLAIALTLVLIMPSAVMAQDSSDATLSALSLGTGVTITPAFASNTTEYRAWVENSVSSVTVTTTTTHTEAVVAITGDADANTPNTATINLTPGLNTITITVTAQASTTETYTVATVREAAAPTQDSNALLTANVTVGEMRDVIGYFAASAPGWGAMTDTNFLVGTAGPYTISSVLVMGDTSASAFQANTVSVCFNAGQHPPADTRNTLTLSIGAHDLAFKDAQVFPTVPTCYEWPRPTALTWSYGDVALVKVTQQAPSDDATLNAITVTPGTVHGFAADQDSYEVGVASTVTQATVTATPADTDASIGYSTTDASSDDGHQVNLSAGQNETTITVTAEDGVTTQEYMVNVNRGVTDDFGWKASDDFDGLTAANINGVRDIWSNGTTLWITSDPTDTLYAYSLSDKAPDATKNFGTLAAAGNTAPTGIWSDDTTMWVADSTDDMLYAYNMETKARDATKDFTTLIAAGNGSPGGIWSDGTTMWIADRVDVQIYAYNMETKAREETKEFTTLIAAGNGNPAGIWSDGTTMWVADSTNEKIYAYNMATKAHYSSQDFDTLIDAGNNTPFGIWSDGTTMWATHSTTFNKIYSFNMPPSYDATLSALTVTPGTVHGFAADQLSYQVGVVSTVTRATVTATANDADASIGYSGTDASTDAGHQVDLSAGRNEVTITVTAEDTTTTKEYTVSINRGTTTPTAGRPAMTWTDSSPPATHSLKEYRPTAPQSGLPTVPIQTCYTPTASPTARQTTTRQSR